MNSKLTFKYNKKNAFPLFEYSDLVVNPNNIESIRDALYGNVWFNNEKWKLRRVVRMSRLSKHLISILNSHGIKKVKHISIGGSFLYEKKANDIDLNVLVPGSYFEYFECFDANKIKKKYFNKVEKISFMVFGEDNVFMGAPVDDQISRNNYDHDDLVMREGLVFSMRNATIFGRSIVNAPIDVENLKVRIARQLDHAQKILLGKSYSTGTDLTKRVSKARTRLKEALVYVEEIKRSLNSEPIKRRGGGD